MDKIKITEAINKLELLFSDASNENYPFTEEFGDAVRVGINALKKFKEKSYIVTNTISNGEYTPTITSSYDEAKDWLTECTASNIRGWKCGCNKDLFEMSDMEVIEWAKKNLPDFEFSERCSKIYYDSDDYNIMNIYEFSWY